MKSICLIGNSHLAALKYGSALLKESGSYRLDYFGSPGRLFGTTSIIDGYMVPDSQAMRKNFRITSGGRDRIEINAYAAFAIAGFAGIDFVFKLCMQCATTEMSQTKHKKLLSRAVFAAVVANTLELQPGIRVAHQLHAATTAPVFVLCRPRPAARGETASQRLQELAVQGDGKIIADLYRSACANLASAGLTVLDQPSQTIVDYIFTDEEYGKESARLKSGKEHPDNDNRHMNAAYGVLVLEQLLAELGIAVERIPDQETPVIAPNG